MKRDDERVVRWRDGEQEGKGEKVQVWHPRVYRVLSAAVFLSGMTEGYAR